MFQANLCQVGFSTGLLSVSFFSYKKSLRVYFKVPLAPKGYKISTFQPFGNIIIVWTDYLRELDDISSHFAHFRKAVSSFWYVLSVSV